MPDKRIITWDALERATHQLIDNIRNATEPRINRQTMVVGVARGGLVPATLVSYTLNMPFFAAAMPSYNHPVSSMRDNLLVIDDICDTGKTFRDLFAHFPNAVYASVYVKPKGKSLVNFYAQEVPQNVWLVFPYAPNDEVNR